MDPKEKFLQKSIEAIKGGSGQGSFYVLFTDITDSLSLDFFYGMEAAETFLDKTEEFLSDLPGIRICTRLYADYFICLAECGPEADEEQLLIRLDSRIRKFMKEQGHRYSSCKLKMVCGVCAVDEACVEEAAARANLAHKEAKRKGSMRSVLYSSDLESQISQRYKKEEAVNRAMEEDSAIVDLDYMICRKVCRYFSKPVEPESFYDEYERMEGRYPLDIDEESYRNEEEGTKRKRFWKAPSFDFIICIVLTLIFIGGSLGIVKSYQKFILNEFSGMVTENLRASTGGQKGAVLSRIAEIFESLEASATAIGQKGDPEFVREYMEVLNDNEENVEFSYTGKEDFDRVMKGGDTKRTDLEAIEKLMNGERIISEVTYSKRRGDIYCIAFGVPVISKEGEVLGAVRGVTDAALLTETNALDKMKEEVLWCFITDGQGDIIPVKAEDEIWKGNLFGHLEKRGVEKELLTQMKEMLHQLSGTAGSLQLGEMEGLPIFISETELGYNDWHLFVCIQASGIHSYVDAIINRSIWGTALQIGVVLTACFGFMALIVRSQKRLSDEKKRYLLIEQFSDVVLFNYDCKKDIMCFTPNIFKFARVHDINQKLFLEYIREKFIYAGDQDIFGKLLMGKIPDEKPEIRIRLLRPDKEKYFWCRMNCRYIYRRGELVSIIGKMEDVDQRKKEEEELMRLAHIDELTGLYNRATLERNVCRKLEEESQGLLFLIDIDKFKQINDSLGHARGDRALSYIGDCIQKVFRMDDVKGRIGGDELMVFIADTDSKQVARQKAGRLAYYLASGSQMEQGELTVSIGIARYPLDGNAYKTLFEAADFAMYTAKKRGGSRYAFYDEVRDEA